MCCPKFHQSREELIPLHKEDGSLNVDESLVPAVIPESVGQHQDNLYLNIELEDSILGFICESGYEVIIIYTSSEAEELC